MKRLCKLYIDMIAPKNTTENPVILNTNKLLVSIKQRLSHFCSHTIVEDVVEIGETTKAVYYCNKCEMTF